MKEKISDIFINIFMCNECVILMQLIYKFKVSMMKIKIIKKNDW